MSALSLLTSQKSAVFVNVLAILSFPLSIFFWWDSRALPEINFFSSSIQPAIVLREQLTGDLKLDGEPLKGNVYAVRLFIWNSGKKSVSGADILPTFKISPAATHDLDRLISAKVIVQSRDEVSAKVSVSPDRSIRPEWLVLEKQDGFSIQLVYVASAPVEWRIEGAVIGQPKIATWDASVGYAHDGKLTVNPSWWRLLTMALLAYSLFWWEIRPLQARLSQLSVLKEAPGQSFRSIRKACRFFLNDYFWLAATGAMMVAAISFAKNWGAPPFFLY